MTSETLDFVDSNPSIYTNRHVGVLIGRFQPFHLGHEQLIEAQIKNGLRNFKIFIGSANSGRTTKNPFTVQERCDMILTGIREMSSFKHDYQTDSNFRRSADGHSNPLIVIKGAQSIKIEIYALNDYIYNDDRWKLEFMTALFSEYTTFNFKQKHVLLGYSKDSSSQYLNEFPELELGLMTKPYLHDGKMIDATDIREDYFHAKKHDDGDKEPPISTEVKWFLQNWLVNNEQVFNDLQDEYRFINLYKRLWCKSPYPPIFVTVDALVQQGNYILLIQRLTQPGKNTWAMPGGFLKENELLETGMIRELREETGLKVPVPVIKGSIVKREVIDDPNRSSRGRTITHVYHVKLAEVSNGVPHIKGASDAKNAKWFPLHEVTKMKSVIFEDHWDIISKFIGF